MGVNSGRLLVVERDRMVVCRLCSRVINQPDSLDSSLLDRHIQLFQAVPRRDEEPLLVNRQNAPGDEKRVLLGWITIDLGSSDAYQVNSEEPRHPLVQVVFHSLSLSRLAEHYHPAAGANYVALA